MSTRLLHRMRHLVWGILSLMVGVGIVVASRYVPEWSRLMLFIGACILLIGIGLAGWAQSLRVEADGRFHWWASLFGITLSSEDFQASDVRRIVRGSTTRRSGTGFSRRSETTYHVDLHLRNGMRLRLGHLSSSHELASDLARLTGIEPE